MATIFHLGRRTTLTFPLLPPPQKNWSSPLDSSPETPIPDGMTSSSSTSPVRESTLRNSLSSPSQVACQSSPSTQVTPVTKRLDSIACQGLHLFRDPIRWIFLPRCCPTHNFLRPRQARILSPPLPGAGIVEAPLPVFGSIFWMTILGDQKEVYRPSKAVPAWPATSIERASFPIVGSKALIRAWLRAQ